MNYNYTVPLKASEAIALNNTHQLKEKLTNQTCSNLRKVLDKGINIVTIYKGNDGRLITTIEISSRDC